MFCIYLLFFFFFFNDTATTEIYTLSLHDALPISNQCNFFQSWIALNFAKGHRLSQRSEEHTSELQSRSDLVCRLLLEKKKKTNVHSMLYAHPLPYTHRLPVDVVPVCRLFSSYVFI